VTRSVRSEQPCPPGGASGSVTPRPAMPVVLLSFLVVLFFLNIVSRLAVGPLLPVIESEFGLRHGDAGSLYSFITFGLCGGLYLSGHVAGRLSYRATIAASGLTLGTALVAISCTLSLSWLRVELLLLGLGSGLYLPAGIALLTERTPESAWGKALAIHELGPNLGYMCAPLLTELLLGFVGWRSVLGAMGVPTLLLSALFLLSRVGGTSRAHPPSITVLARLAGDRTFWGAAFLFAVSIGVGLGLYTMMPLFLVNDIGMNRVSANLLTGMSRISGLFSVFVAGALADRIGRPRTIVLSLAAAGSCAVLLGLFRGPWITPLLVFLQAASAASFYPAGFSLLSSAFPPAVRNVAVSMVLIVASLLGGGGVPPLVGVLADGYSFSFAFGAAGVGTLAAVLLFQRIPGRGIAYGREEGRYRSARR
jgi:MFS family permease